MVARLAGIRRYPVKSFRGHDLATALVEPWGLSGDRRWMVVAPDGIAVTARVEPRMLLVRPEPLADGLVLHGPDVDPLRVALPDPTRRREVEVWSDRVPALDAGDAAALWISTVLGREVRLVHLDDPMSRPVDPDVGVPGDTVSFADGFPVLLTSESSLASLNEAIAERDPDAMVPMTRFRPNVVVGGADAWAEDDWRRIRIGEVVFRVAGGCARCVLTMVDPDTAEKGPEPIRTLARIRRFDGATWFGTDLIPEHGTDGGPAPTIRVGDPVEVLESVEPGRGPLRASTR